MRTMRLTSYRPARYLSVGAACAVANNLIMIAGDRLGIHYAALTTLCFALVTPFAYWMHTAFTFETERSFRGFFLFSAGVATAFPISLLLMALLYSGLGAPMIVAAPVTTVLLFVWNYFSARTAILR